MTVFLKKIFMIVVQKFLTSQLKLTILTTDEYFGHVYGRYRDNVEDKGNNSSNSIYGTTRDYGADGIGSASITSITNMEMADNAIDTNYLNIQRLTSLYGTLMKVHEKNSSLSSPHHHICYHKTKQYKYIFKTRATWYNIQRNGIYLSVSIYSR